MSRRKARRRTEARWRHQKTERTANLSSTVPPATSRARPSRLPPEGIKPRPTSQPPQQLAPSTLLILRTRLPLPRLPLYLCFYLLNSLEELVNLHNSTRGV